MTLQPEKKRRKGLGFLEAFLCVVAVIALAVGGFIAFRYFQGWQAYQKMQDECVVGGVAVTDGLDDLRADDYLSIDFSKLKANGKDLRGWLELPDLGISYPLMQGQDNEYYLHRGPDGQWLSNGSIFLDYRNGPISQDSHLIVFGHNMNDKSMFGKLSEYQSRKFFKSAGKKVRLYTVDEVRVYEIFSVFVADPWDEVVTLVSDDEKDMKRLQRYLMDKSEVESDVALAAGDQVLTLSTCSEHTARLTVHAKYLGSVAL